MKKWLFLAFFSLSLVSVACERVEVEAIEKCTKILGTKIYKVEPFGAIEKYFVLADGRELDYLRTYFKIDKYSKEYCETEYVPVPSKKTVPTNKIP